MNQYKTQLFNDRFYELINNDPDNENCIKLLTMCRFPGVALKLTDRIGYTIEIIYKYYDNCNEFEIEQINKLIQFINKQLKFEQLHSDDFDDCLYYKQQCDYLKEDEKQLREYEYNYSYGGYEDEGHDESFY